MSDALTPLRHVYGLATRAAAAPGAPGHAEQELLRGMALALDAALPVGRRPSDAALDAVRAAAAEAAATHAQALDAVRYVYGEGGTGGGAVEVAVLRQSREAVERAFAARPQPCPDAATLDAVQARAAETTGEEVPTDRPALAPLAVALGGAGTPSAESALLAQSLDALARAPRPRPSSGAVGAVLAFAERASAGSAPSAGLDAVRFVYEGGERPEGVEPTLLEQSREVVERALIARPQPRPEAATVDAVLARAAEASGQRADEPTVSDRALAPLALAYGLPLAVEAGGGVEAALLVQSHAALDRLRPARPSGAVLANVLDRAAAARRRPARADRPAAPPARRRIPAPVWAGGAALMLAALTAVAVLPGLFGRGGTPAGPAQVATAETTAVPEIAAVGVGSEGPESEATASADETPAAPAVSAPTAGLAPVAERRVVSARPAPAQRAPAPPRPTPDTPTWEAGEDVRALSLRLDEIDRSIEGLAWDEPAEAFGRPAGAPSVTSTPGLRSVREGAAPARARIQPADSSRTPR